jgi:hypothetical protein
MVFGSIKLIIIVHVMTEVVMILIMVIRIVDRLVIRKVIKWKIIKAGLVDIVGVRD